MAAIVRNFDEELPVILPQNDQDGQYASPMKYTPFQLLRIPWDQRWMLNLDSRDLPDGELEAGRKIGGRAITWLVDYSRPEVEGQDYIYFYSQDPRYGGPFSFMSNHYPSEFVVDAGPDHTFTTMEQFYQYSKAVAIGTAEERWVYFEEAGREVCSRELANHIRDHNNPNHCAAAGRCFNSKQKDEPEWWAEWSPAWQVSLPFILQRGVLAKFEQNPGLENLLIMTGDFNLVKAADGDRRCGVGYHASVAKDKMETWGQNLMGHGLEQVRDMISETSGIQGRNYAFKFWRMWEETCNYARYLGMRVRAVAPVKLPGLFVPRESLMRRGRGWSRNGGTTMVGWRMRLSSFDEKVWTWTEVRWS